MARQQRRSRLRFGLGGWGYLLVLIVVGTAAVYTQANLLFWMLGLMAGAWLMSLMLTMASLRHVTVERLLPDHAVAGDANVLRYQITNGSWLPIFGLTVSEVWRNRGRKGTDPLTINPPMLLARPHGWVMHIGPRQGIQVEAPCWPLRRGRLNFERIMLASSFPFGVVGKVVQVTQSAELTVYPHLFRLNRRLLFTLTDYDPSGQKQLERGGGMEDFFGLRPYYYGDSLKMIDWRHSARTGELVSREMTQPSPPRFMLLLDMRRLEEAVDQQPEPADCAIAALSARLSARQRAVERAVSLTASLVCEAHFRGYQVGLAAVGCRFPVFPVHHSLPHRARILKALAELDVDEAANHEPALPARPSVMVVPGAGSASSGRRGPMGAVMFGAAELETYVMPNEHGRQLLQAPQRTHTRREQLRRQARTLRDAPAEEVVGSVGG